MSSSRTLPALVRTLGPAPASRLAPVARRPASTIASSSSSNQPGPAAAAAATSSSSTYRLPSSGGHIPTTSNPTEFEAIAEARVRGAVKGKGHARRLPTEPSPTELPNPHSYLKAVIATVTLGALSWAGFLAFVTNGEKSSSSVFRQVMFVMRTSALVDETLGEAVVLEKTWWTGGEPWVSGSISVLKGRADLSFRLRGSRNSGRVYFTSIRPNATSAFHVLRFKLILDDPVLGVEKGEEVDLRREMLGKGYDLDGEEVPLVLGQLLGTQAAGGMQPKTPATTTTTTTAAAAAASSGGESPSSTLAFLGGQSAGGVGSAGEPTTGLDLGALKLV